MQNYEEQYLSALSKIYYSGYADGVNERTGKVTKRLPGIVIQVDVEKEFPILQSKQVYGITAIREIEWIWKQQSNNIHDLKGKIWNEWADRNGSIGNAYGSQIARPINIYTDPIHKTPESFRSYPNQAKFILDYLREFPNGRWGVVTLWNTAELSQMNLVPCCHTTTWNLDGGRLNCLLDQRSGDMPYGVPFNTTQYAALMCMFARDLGVKPGILTHVIADAHIYDNQMDGVKLQLLYSKLLYTPYNFEDRYTEDEMEYILKNSQFNTPSEVYEAASKLNEVPKLEFDTDQTDFFSYDATSCKLVNYHHMGPVDFGEIAV